MEPAKGLDLWDQKRKTVAILGPPGAQREELFLSLLGSSLTSGNSLVIHSKPFVRVDRLYDIIEHRKDLLSHVFFRYVPTLESQEDAIVQADLTSAALEASSVFFDAPCDNYLVSLAIAASSPPKLKAVNASYVKQFAYLKEASRRMNLNVLVVVGSQSGVNTLEAYLLQSWPDLIIKVSMGSQPRLTTDAFRDVDLSSSRAKVVSSEGFTLTSSRDG